jgi:hypothetical protein
MMLRLRRSAAPRARRGLVVLLLVVVLLVVALNRLDASPPPSKSPTNPPPTPTTRLVSPLRTRVIAYCVYPENKAVPTGHAEFMARTYGPHIFPASEYLLVLRPVLPLPSDLPKDIDPLSDEGLDMLGLENAHIRFCSYGSSKLISLLEVGHKAVVAKETFANAQARLKAAGLWLPEDRPNKQGWTHGGIVHWPEKFAVLVSATKTKKPPLIFRHSPEPLSESVHGVSGQLEVKRSELSTVSVTVYWPMILDSMAFRWSHGNSTYGKKIGGRFDTIREVVTRPPGFSAREARLRKQFFASSVSQHCAGRRAHYPSVVVRELFSYALHQVARKPVNNIGECPDGDFGATRAGLTVEERKNLQSRLFKHTSVVDIHSKHKFAITFENSGADGYFTEKIVSGYLGRAVPVYCGPNDFTGVLNPKALINCALPYNVTSYGDSMRMKRDVCASLTPVPRPKDCDETCMAEHGRKERDNCANAYNAEVERIIWPALLKCAEKVVAMDRNDAAYEAMLSEPLVPLNKQTGELTGIWNVSMMGRAIRAVFVGAGLNVDEDG